VKVSIVIPTSNGSRFLGPCLESLRKTRLPPGAVLEPIVVDNGSSDRTPQILAQHPEVKSLVFERAMGFAQANNAARKVATGDLICFLNNDTQVDPGWLDRPLQILARDARVAGIGSKLLYMHRYVPVRFSLPRGARLRATASMFGSPLNDKVRFSPDVRDGWVHDGSVLYVPLPVPGIDPPFSADPVVRLAAPAGTVEGATVTVCASAPRSVARLPAMLHIDPGAETVRLVQNAGNFLNDRLEGGDFGSGEEETAGRFASEEIVPAICGAALIVRREALDSVGWFPDYYTMYYEDVDLCLLLRGKGGLLVFCPSSVVNHYHTGTSREYSAKFIEHVARSSLLFTSRYGTPARFAGALLERLGHTRNELLRGRWAAAAGTRGLVSALLALRRPLMSRIRASLEGSANPTELVRSSRAPYSEAR